MKDRHFAAAGQFAFQDGIHFPYENGATQEVMIRLESFRAMGGRIRFLTSTVRFAVSLLVFVTAHAHAGRPMGAKEPAQY